MDNPEIITRVVYFYPADKNILCLYYTVHGAKAKSMWGLLHGFEKCTYVVTQAQIFTCLTVACEGATDLITHVIHGLKEDGIITSHLDSQYVTVRYTVLMLFQRFTEFLDKS